jgi:hypothetical protein
MREYTSKNKWNRSMKRAPNKRRECCCGCNGRLTHIGLGDGAGMMSGCELTVRRWVRDGAASTI